MSRQILIRAVIPEDLKAISVLEHEAFDSNAYPSFFFRQAYDVFGDLFRIAENESGEITGYVLGSIQSGSPDGWILSLAVREEHQRRGIAKLLVTSLLERLSEKGAETVLLTVEPDNEKAIKTYRSLGFNEENTIADCFGPGEARTVMRRKVSHENRYY